MGSFILRGISMALLVTVLTLFAGMAWGALDLGGVSISRLLDIGLLASCLVGGYWTAKESNEWLLGGFVGVGYVTVGTLLLALFLPIQGWGFIKVLAEGAIIGLVAGAVGAGGVNGAGRGGWSGSRSHFTPSYDSYDTNDDVSNKVDWDREEQYVGWNEGPITKGNQDAERSSDVEWPWECEEKNEEHQGWKEAPINKGIQSSDKRADVQWPWNKGKKVLIDSEPRYVETGYLEPMRINTSPRSGVSVNKVSEAKPWWE